MADFIARIRAELDASQAQAQLRQLTSAQHVIPVRIELDASSINNLFRNLGSGSSGGLIQNFGNLGKQAGNAFVDNYFREQRQLARRAKQLQDQFPTSKVQSRADSFYLKAARAEAQEATKIEKEKLAEQEKIRKVFEQQQVQERRRQAKEIQREQTARQKEEEKLQRLFEQQQVQTRRKQYQEQQALERQETRRIESERAKTQRVFEQQQVLQRQQASQYSQSFNNGKYTADQTVMGENLKAYDGQNTEALGRARAALEEYKGIMAELQQHYDPSQTLSFNDGELVNKFNNLENAAEKYKNAMREVGAESTKSISRLEAATESNKILKYYNDNSKAAKKYGDQLLDLADRMSKATTAGEKQGIIAEFNNVKSAISAEGLNGRTVFDEISRGFTKIGQFVGTYRLIMETVKTIKKMVNEVTQVDSALIELRKVSNASDAEIQQSFEAATTSAKKYGEAISDVINSQADWARLGYGVKEAQQLADVTTLFQTVGDNMTQETASQGLISILKGYQMDVSQAESIVDKLNEVANTSPIDTAGLTEALERSVSSMAMAGNTLDESIGLITAANAVVQDPASVGTAFKTLSARIRGAKTELEEAGLDTEGMADSVSKLREELLSLTGVDIQLNEDTFKSTFDILKEISEVWDDLSDISRANVIELIAGKRQANVVSALMTNFDIAEQVADTSANRSEGSAQKELENFQKGIEYSLGRFKASFQELSTDFISSDLVKGVVDFGTQIMNVLDMTIGKFGALNTVIAGVGIGAFAKNFMGLRTTILDVVESFTMMDSLADVPTALGLSFETLASKIGLSTTALGAFVAVAAGLVVVAKVLEAIHVSADEALESFTKQKDSFDSTKADVDDLNSQLEETQSKINALEAKGNLSLVEQEDLENLKIQNERLERTLELREAELKLEARKTGTEAHKLYNEWTTEDGLFKNGKSNAYNTNRIASKVDQDWVAQDIVAGLIYGNAGGESRARSMTDNFNAEANKDDINELIAAYKSYQKIIDEIDKAESTLGKDQVDLRRKLEESRVEIEGKALDVQEYIDGYASVMSYVKEAYTQMQDSGLSLSDVQQSELIEAQKFLNEYNDMITNAAKNIEETIEDILDKDAFDNVFDEIAEKYSSGQTDAMREVIENNKALMEELKTSGITPDQLVSYVANKVDPDKLNLDSIRDQLRKTFGDAVDDVSDEEIEILYKYVNANNVNLDDLAPDDLEATIHLAIEASGAVNIDQVAEAFNNATGSSKTLLDTIDSINSAINSQKTGEVLSPETFSSDDLIDYRDALESVNGTMQYNIDKVKALNKAKVEEQIANNNAAKALEQVKWKENARDLAEYRSKLAELTEGSDEYSKVQADITRLESDNEEIVNKCTYLDLYNQKLRESIGAYQEWLNAQNGGESGDMSNDVRAAMKNIKDVFDSESSEFGKIGTHKYEAAVEFLVPDEVSAEGESNIQSYISKLGEYFNGEKSGVDKFVQEGIDKQLFEYDPDTQQLKVVAGKTMQDFADAMMSEEGGWTMEAVQAMFGLLDDYTKGDFSFESMFKDIDESGIDNVTESTNSAADAAEAAADSYDKLKKSVSDFKNEQAEGRDTAAKPSATPSTVSDLSTDTLRKEQLSLRSGTTGATVGGESTPKTMEVVVTPVQDPNPLEIITQAQDDGKISVFANTPDGNGVLVVQVKPENDGKINVSAVTPDGGEVLNVDVNPENDGVVNVSAVTPDGGDILNVKLAPENDGKVNVSAVTADGGEVLNVDIDGQVGDTTTALAEMQSNLDANPLTVLVNYEGGEDGTGQRVSQVEQTLAGLPSNTSNESNTPQDQTATVTTKMDNSEIDEGVEHVKEEVTSVDGMSATANVSAELGNSITDVRTLNTEINGLPSFKSIVIETVKRTKNEDSGGGDLNGTAHVRGTAYSSGNWGADRDEYALTGELGREILVDPRTGKWHTIGDNGAEFVHVKRGDIIFNHKQTEELLSRGFVNGRGSAYVGGTAYVQNQKIDGGVGFTFGSGSSTSNNTKAQVANTKATNDNTKSTKKNSKSAKKLGELYDWVAVRLQYFADQTKKIADQITDYVSSATKTSLLSRQISANQSEIAANQRGADLYLDQANVVAKESKMSSKLIKKAQTGAWQFEKLSDKDKEKVQNYLKYYDKYKDAQQKVQDLRNEQLELYEQWANMPAEDAAKKVEKLTNAVTLLTNAYNIATSGASALAKYASIAARSSATKNSTAASIARSSGSIGYQAGNKLLDQQTKQMEAQMKAYETAYNQATANRNAAKANITASRNAATSARNAVKSKANSILNSKYAKNFTTAQKNALKSGGLVNTKGLSGNALKYIKQYNALVSEATTKANSATDAVTKYNIATQAQEAAIQQLAESQEEYAQMIIENEKKKFDNIKNFYDLEINQQKSIADNFEKDRKLWEAYGKDLSEEEFLPQIDAMNKQVALLTEEREVLEKQLNSAISKGIIKGSEEWLNLNNQILAVDGSIKELTNSVLELQDEMRKGVFYQALDKALKKADELRGSLDTIKDIISEEMMFDDDGRMTDFGITSLAMDVKEYESYLDSMGTLLEKRQKYIDAFGDGENDTNYSQKEFDEDMSAITKEIQDLLKNATSVRKAIIDMIAKTSKAELDALLKAIDARKELLKKQKDYYDYDKSLKSKTKDIQLLEQQERALQNSANAEDKAMLARIRAQKQEAQEALEDTVREHVYNLQVEGLDDLKTDLQDNYEKYVKDLNSNLDMIVEAVNGATETVVDALDTVNSAVETLLGSYGVSGLTGETVGVPHFASGTRRVGRNTYGLTNEGGNEIVIGDRGVFVPLSASSAVMKPDLTNKLFGLADNYEAIMSLANKNAVIPAIQGNEGNAIAPIINAPISIVGNKIDEQGVIRAIHKELPVISKTVQNDIRKDLRKSR